MRLALAKGAYGALMRQIEADAALLARMGVMDYSLLLGVHYPKWGDDTWLPPGQPNPVRTSPMSWTASAAENASLPSDQVSCAGTGMLLHALLAHMGIRRQSTVRHAQPQGWGNM